MIEAAIESEVTTASSVAADLIEISSTDTEPITTVQLLDTAIQVQTIEEPVVVAVYEGMPGSTGQTGQSAYEIAVAQGFIGTQAQWLDSLKGTPGEIHWEEVISKEYIHEQQTASTLWTIQHNLFMYPAVTVVDSAGTEVEGSIKYIDMNTVELEFSNPFAGRAFMS